MAAAAVPVAVLDTSAHATNRSRQVTTRAHCMSMKARTTRPRARSCSRCATRTSSARYATVSWRAACPRIGTAGCCPGSPATLSRFLRYEFPRTSARTRARKDIGTLSLCMDYAAAHVMKCKGSSPKLVGDPSQCTKKLFRDLRPPRSI